MYLYFLHLWEIEFFLYRTLLENLLIVLHFKLWEILKSIKKAVKILQKL